MKIMLILFATLMFFGTSSAYAFVGQSKTYKIESDFGIVGPSEMVVFPTAFQFETKEINFYVPFTAVDFTRLEDNTITVSVRGRLIIIRTTNQFHAKGLYHDLTHAIAGDYLDKD